MPTFIGEDWEGAPDLSCGTTACGMGWSIPWFGHLEGLRLSAKAPRHQNSSPLVTRGKSGRLIDWEVAAHLLFGLNSTEFYKLFIRTACEVSFTPKKLAKHIRLFVKEKDWKYAA
jgi:hypothetical protein